MPDTRLYKLTKADLKKFSSSLGDVLGYIKYSKDKKALSKFLNDSQVMVMDNDAARVIRDITNTPIYVPDGKGEIDMCKAVRDMIDERVTRGTGPLAFYRRPLSQFVSPVAHTHKCKNSAEEMENQTNFSVQQPVRVFLKI